MKNRSKRLYRNQLCTIRNGMRPMEPLESRRLYSGTLINFPNFSDTSHLVSNFDFSMSTPRTLTMNTDKLILTSNQFNEATSVWYDTKVSTDQFTTHFRITPTPSPFGGNADGFAFVLQNGTTSAIGAIGGSLGYEGGSLPAESAAFEFNFYNRPSNSFDYGIATGGGFMQNSANSSPMAWAEPNAPGTSEPFDVWIRYDGSNLTTTAVSTTDSSVRFANTQAIDLHTVLNSNNAYAGFTGATGGETIGLSISRWEYSSIFRDVTIPTRASGAPVGKTKKSSLSVSAVDAGGENEVNYTWSVERAPSGAKPVVFSANGTHSAKSATATFSKDGTYRVRVTAENPFAQTDSSVFLVNVTQSATSIQIAPHAAHVSRSGGTQYSGIVFDQFKHAMRTQPALTWSVQSGAGSISTSGMYNMTSGKGHVVVAASDTLDDLLSTVGATVIAA